MKKNLLFLLVFFCGSQLFSQSQRLVLVEEFTQASCPPCEASTPQLNSTLEANATKLVQLRYQTSWPGVDPMNADNPGEVRTRVDYYGVTGVPTALVGGVVPTGNTFPALVSNANIDARYGVSSPVAMDLTHSFSADLSTVSFTLNITNEGMTDYDAAGAKLRIALVEEKISWPTPPGSTSIQVFDAVMKTFYTGPEGIDVAAIPAGETWTMTWDDMMLPPSVYDYRELALVAFIQDDVTKDVHQSAHSSPQVLSGFPDFSIEAVSPAASGLCEYDYQPQVMVTNIGDGAATAGFTVDATVNGNVAASVDVTDLLGAGESIMIDFPLLTLDGGTNNINFVLSNAGFEYASLNNASLTDTQLKISAPQSTLQAGFEDEQGLFYPTNAALDLGYNISFVVMDQQSVTDYFGGNVPAPDALGAYGTSINSLWVNFYQWDPNAYPDNDSEMTLIDQLDLTEALSASLSFDRAYAMWSGAPSADGMEILISDDCGETWTVVYENSGTSMATVPAQDPLYVPGKGDWVTDDIDISQYSGKNITVKVRVISAWGNNLWLDNINVNYLTNTLDEIGIDEMNVSPNPTSDMTNIEFELNESKAVSVVVYSALGQKVYNKNFGTLNGYQNLQIDMSDLNEGVYNVKINFDEKSTSRLVSKN